MALNELYQLSPPLQYYFADLTSGLPLAGGIAYFYHDNNRSLLKPIYELSGVYPTYSYVALPNPVVLSAAGTIQDASNNDVALYLYPFDANGNLDLYYVVVTDSMGNPIFTREAWPNVNAEDEPVTNEFPQDNQISNPQFTRTFLNPGGIATTYTATAAVNQTYIFAPDWNFVISGTGTVVVQQIPIAGNSNVVTSPPYTLDITIGPGITTCNLVQTFSTNSGLWASTATQNIFLAGALVAKNINVGTTSITMQYQDSVGPGPINILSSSFDNNNYTLLQGTTADPLPISTNTNTGNAAFVNIIVQLPINSRIQITSLTVIPISSASAGQLINWNNQSTNREQALMGDYFIPHLEAKRIKSLLVGWDFPVNPAQFGSSGSFTATAGYIWDQTIAQGTTNSVSYARDALTGGLQFTTGANNDAFAIVQYLTGSQVSEILGHNLSVNVNAFSSVAGVTMRVYLCNGSSSATFPTLASSGLIGTFTNGSPPSTAGIFTITAANWNLIPRGGLDTATANLNIVSSNTGLLNNNNYGFTGWQITNSTQLGNTNKFAIVVTFAYTTTGTVITVPSISVNIGKIPSEPMTLSPDETLRQCQYYYEKSYALGTTVGTNTTANSIINTQGFINDGSAGHVRAAPFQLTYKSIKLTTAPAITFYTPAGTANKVTAVIWATTSLNNSADVATTGSPYWSFSLSDNALVATPLINTDMATEGGLGGSSSVLGYINYHYTLSCRPGIEV